MNLASKVFAILPFLPLLLMGCSNRSEIRPTPPAAEVIERTVYAKAPAYLAPRVAKPTPLAEALVSGGSLLDAWLRDREGLESCAAQAFGLWRWASTGGENAPGPPKPLLP